MIDLNVTWTGVTPTTSNTCLEATIRGAGPVQTPVGPIVPDRAEVAFRDGEMRWLLLAGRSDGHPDLRANWTFKDVAVAPPFVLELIDQLRPAAAQVAS